MPHREGDVPDPAALGAEPELQYIPQAARGIRCESCRIEKVPWNLIRITPA